MKTILIVDDNKLNLTAARMVLSNNYRVVPVMRGQQALSYLENGECDIILLDINMPEMDGFQVMEKIRSMERWRSIPVIFLTADNDAETETRCFSEGAADFIAKPFVPDVMLSRIGRILELEDLRRSLADRLEAKTREVADIKNLAQQDALTGLWDRVYTEDAVTGLLKSGGRGALMMIDIDNFKSVNDTYGHIAGDQVLQMLADTLRHFSDQGDILCRMGGDEFLVYANNRSEKAGLSRMAGDIISDLWEKMAAGGFENCTSVSIGIAQAPEDGEDFATLYNRADKALYYVKQNGKNDYHFFSDRLRADKRRSGEAVDLRYLQDLMRRADGGMGAYNLDFDSFQYVYNFLRRFVEFSRSDIRILLFTINEPENVHLDPAGAEQVLELLEKAVSASLRRSDVTSRYSDRQLIVILTGAGDAGDKIAERIIERFDQLYTGGKVRIDYGTVNMESQS